jgi:hypothetical protein
MKFTDEKISDILWAQYEDEFENWLNLMIAELDPIRSNLLKKLKERKLNEFGENEFRGFTRAA